MDNNNDNLFDFYGTSDSESRNDPKKDELVETVEEESHSFISDNIKNKKDDDKVVPDYIMEGSKKRAEYGISDEELVREFVGPNYPSIAKENLSLNALFFGGAYLVYRKEYIPGLVAIMCNVCVTLPFFKISKVLKGLLMLISLGISIYYALFFKKNYMRKARRIAKDVQATDSSNDSKRGKVRMLGGIDNRIYSFAAIGIVGYSIYSVAMSFNTQNIIDKYKETFEPLYEYTIPDWTKGNIRVNSEGTSVNNTFLFYDKFFDYRKDNVTCSYRISMNNQYITSQGNFSDQSNRYLDYVFNKDLSSENVYANDLKFKFYKDEDSYTHYYVHPGPKQMIAFVSTNKNEDSTCEKLEKEILNSIKEK